MVDVNPIFIGAVVLLAGGAVAGMAILSPRSRGPFIFAQLVIMTGIYIGFAIAALDSAEIVTRAHWSALIIESAIALGLMAGGLYALQMDRGALLGALILVHGGVDLLHLMIGADHSPDWYEFLCILYDAIVGFAAVWLMSDVREKNPAPTPSL